MAYTVYCHTNKINGKRYVGITKQKPEVRWCNGHGYDTQYFRRAIDKYGWEEFTHEILFTNLTEDEAKQKEIELIAKWDLTNPNKGYNITMGGDGTANYHHTESAKLKMSIAKMGTKIPDNVKAKMSKSAIGKTKSDVTRKKMSEYAKHRSLEHRRKIIESQRNNNKGRLGKHNTDEQKRMVGIKNGKAVKCIETNTVYYSCGEASKYLNILPSAIARVARGERNHVHGLHFVFVGDKYGD